MGASVDRLVAVGLSHHTAPVQVRERLAFDEAAVRAQLDRLTGEGVCDEALLLSTCNRVELYGVADTERLRAWMDEFRGPGGESLDNYLYWKAGREAVHHLFRVACSLDSQVVGEPQILGQVKDAVRIAEDSHTLGRLLRPLADRSFSLAKKVRNDTDIGRGRVGIGNAGVDLAMQVYGGLGDKRGLLVGTGDMGRQVARALQNNGLAELLVASRTDANAREVAEAHGATAIPWARWEDYLARVDVIITATGSRVPILGATQVTAALKARRYRPLLLVDLSVPRNIAFEVDNLDDAYLFNIDDLSRVVEEGRRSRAEATERAGVMVAEEADRFVASLRQIDPGPAIRALTQHGDRLRQAELERSRKLVEGLDDVQVEALDKMTRSLVKKLLHQPIQAIRNAAREGDHSTIERIVVQWKEKEDL